MSITRLELTRDGVCAGDDADTPHPRTVVPPSPLTLDEAIATIGASDYLARIFGGKATWVAYLGERPIAVVAQEWRAPEMLAHEQPVPTGTVRLHFAYRAQADPHEVLARLRATLP